ncbi:MAG: hypothetical protein V7719_14955 [Psychroserpens sp.]|uniref:hypothetical protein n=1 Tax=Psychroserpens sp. TaxID=2020870 RepID=UPI003001CF61
MRNLNLIFTTHKPNGECNPDALYEIIEIISPDIIFEELSHANYDKVYNAKTLITLETTAIKKHLKNKDIVHIPVDTFDMPNHYYDNIDYMLDKLLHGFMLQESFELKNLIDKHSSLIYSNGFPFLNSDINNKIFEQIDILKDKLLKKINNEKLYNIAQLEKDVIEKRENEILNNIYNYSKKHPYKQALLFVGSGHRRAFIDKIEKRKKQEEQKINWIFHNL